MATRAQIAQLLGEGLSYESAAARLGIPAGLAFMIATGRPADGSDAPAPEKPARKPALPGSAQQLVTPPAVDALRNLAVLAWVRERASRELNRS